MIFHGKTVSQSTSRLIAGMLFWKETILVFDKPHFVVKLHQNMIEVDLKEEPKKKLEDVIEAHPALKKL